MCVPLFLSIQWTDARKRRYDKSYPNAGEPATSTMYQNQGAPEDDRYAGSVYVLVCIAGIVIAALVYTCMPFYGAMGAWDSHIWDFMVVQ
jgi:hypothetical protein